MNSFLSSVVRHFMRRGQVGQSIIILAIGFIGLIGFVGIVTDVSLLFVRYSSLRRAVDAAAVAAAGQFRRVADDPGAGISGEAASLATLTLAARQFIELYGLDPSNVLVETCRAQNIQRDANGNPVFVNPGDQERYLQLCTPDELKLVRVTAQIDSPTVFLRLLGQPSIVLTESAISQTAVIDVVLVFDVSESMLEDTQYSTWAAAGYDTIYVPPVINYADPAEWKAILDTTHNQHRASYTHYTFDPTGNNEALRTECQWFAWPTNYEHSTRFLPAWLRTTYETAFTGLGLTTADLENHFLAPGATQLEFTGFQPTYNYFGCCNDPNGDGNFDDLLCEPFRSARDAAEEFLARLDFLRGDRVAFVAFDRSAYLIDPDGAGPQPPMIEVERTLDRDAAGTVLNVGDLQYREGAVEVLRRLLGVRAEPAFYADSNNDGRWDGLFGVTDGVRTYNDYRITPTNQIFDFPVASACPFDQALSPPSRFGMLGGDEFAYRDDLGNPVLVGLYDNYYLIDSVLTTPLWYVPGPGQNNVRRASYEQQASCAGGNFGAALQTVNNALFENARREGAVWMMVMLGDGAAGASSPMSRDGITISGEAQPFVFNNQFIPEFGRSMPVHLPVRGIPPDLSDLTPSRSIYPPAGYGAFGLCPYGTDGNPGEILIDIAFPFCSDKQPETRSYCSVLAVQPNLQAMDGYLNCIELYDVDDYARDWADWVGVANLNIAGATGRTSEQLLPTIFTIGFGIDFQRTTGRVNGVIVDCAGLSNRLLWECLRSVNLGDYLGEELLRYLADVGDNFRVDDDYWQSLPVLRDRLPNGVDPATANPEDYGQRGVCQLTIARAVAEGYPSQDAYAPLPPRESCGNYYNAPTAAELNLVFNEIASRMFTRLTQ